MNNKKIHEPYNLPTLDDFFERTHGSYMGRVEKIDTNRIENFKNHPFKVKDDEQMENLVDLVYFKAVVPKLVIQIGNNIDNVILLSKVINHRISKRKTEMNALLMIMDLPQYKKLCTGEIIKSIAGFYAKKENRAILCKENPNNTK